MNMNFRHSEGFTILELLVATMLLAMLVTILTMIFNQSSIAWTVGTASISDLGEAREKIAICSNQSNNVLLADDNQSLIISTSIWNEDGALRERTVVGNNVNTELKPNELKDDTANGSSSITINADKPDKRTSYIVGVTSYGPDGKANTFDDITTMPEEVVK